MKRKVYLLTLFNVIVLSTIMAQEINYQQPPNSSFLAEYAISPKIFNVIVSPMYQEDAIFHAITQTKEVIGTNEKSVAYEVIYNPFYEYGLSLELIVKDENVYRQISRSRLKKQVGKTYEKYKKIRDQDLITSDEVGFVSDDGSEVILGFKVKKESLPNYLKYLSNLNGKVIIHEGVLDRIELNLASPTKISGIQATSARYTYNFVKPEGGGYLLESSTEYIKGTKDSQQIETTNTFDVIHYRKKEGEAILSFDQEDQSHLAGEVQDTFKVKLERALPFLGNAARKAGYELPLPYGVDLFTHFQREDLGLDKIILDGDDLTEGVLAPGNSSASAITNMVAARGDVWLLPFVNVTLISGRVFGNTEINLALSDDVKDALGLIGIEADNVSASIDVTGPVVGGGMTLAGGYKNLFATVNAMYIKQFVKEAGTDVDAIAITPLVGVRFPKIVNAVIGGQYQIYNSNVSGSLEVEGETLNYDVELKTTKWNWLVGLQRDFSNRWNGTIMVGGKPRPQTTIVLGYRF